MWSPQFQVRAVALFTLTVFMGSGLLFLVQPMFAKLVLPRLGGSPSVWNTCVLFFQTDLLLAYLYAHFSTRWLGVRRQALWHLIVLLAPLTVLPLTIGDAQPPASGSPVWWLLGTMTLRIGLPFFVVSASAPLLQRWVATLPVSSAGDPYFLYAASNLGSMLALFGYPLMLEPSVGVRYQTWLWTGGYLTLAVLAAACAIVVAAAANVPSRARVAEITAEPVSWLRRLRWAVLSCVPSSLMLGVTTHVSTDIAAVPLLWVLPLGMYLGTFVLAFSQREILPHRALIRILPALVFGCLITILVNARAWWLIPLHLVTFFVCAMVCHRELARDRPDVRHLTEFYLWISVGGALGGAFNSLVAPQVFTQVLEYPLGLALAAVVRPTPAFREGRMESSVVLLWWPAFLLLSSVVIYASGLTSAELGLRGILLGFTLLATLGYMFANRPEPFGAMAMLFVALIAFGRPGRLGTVLFAGRSFFGVHRVIDAPDHSYHLLLHGSTSHGRQQMGTAATSCEPTGYYHPSGPIGQVFDALGEGLERVAVVGLGSGGLACYARSGQRWTFYEIDPLVEQIARDPRYFTFLLNTQARTNVVIGDGRMTLQRASRDSYDLVVLDAFSSDAIPIHLLTGEAIEIYLSRLRSKGVIAIDISNRYLQLEPVVAALSHREGLFALARFDGQISDADAEKGRWPSLWVVLARTQEPLASLVGRPGWRRPETSERVSPWTDDYSNLLQVLRLR